MTSHCDLFLEDPEKHRDHIAECESCRRLDMSLRIAPDVEPDPSRVASGLPLAPWEGAAHRAWGMVAAIASVVIVAAASLFILTGVSPIQGFVAVLRSLIPRFDVISVFFAIPKLLEQAPIKFHLVVATAFVAINVLFVLLLRRPPKGYDVTLR